MGPFQYVLLVVWGLSTLGLIALVLMHSGKGTGISDMIANSLYNSSTGVFFILLRPLFREGGILIHGRYMFETFIEFIASTFS